MSVEVVAASKTPILPVRLWFHLPVSILTEFDLAKQGWSEEGADFDFAMHTYFHPTVAKALSADSKSFRSYTKRSCAGLMWSAIRTSHNRCFHGELKSVEYRENADTSGLTSKEAPKLGIVTVALEVTGVSVFSGKVLDSEEEMKPATLTLADAQNAIDWFRRIFPRWWRDDLGTTGDTLSQIKWGDGGWSKPLKKAHFQPKTSEEPVMLLPWVAQLLHPLTLDGDESDHFGEERALVCSEIALKMPDKASHADERAAILRIRDGDWFRLAEADSAGDADFPYSPEYLNGFREEYFYDRHAPSRDGKHGNASRIVMSNNHLCMLGAGSDYEKHVRENMGKFYRHMQFLCVFEYFRLLQFSKRLTEAVLERRTGKATDAVFRARLRDIRLEFLDHTHLHHFTNVSSQLQPREMYERLYRVMGLQGMHTDLEDEMRIATDYAASCDEQEQSRRAERINELVNLGVPLALVAGLLGMNVLVGEHWPFDTATTAKDLSLAHHIHQISVVALVVMIGWLGVTQKLLPHHKKTHTKSKSGWVVWTALFLAFTILVTTFSTYS